MSPLVSLVGRPNVGKSSLYNRLTGQRAITHWVPGVTRECHRARAHLSGNKEITLMDTPGFSPDASLGKPIHQSDLILFVVDGREGLIPLDKEIMGIIHRSKRPFFLLVNKIDSWAQEFLTLEFAPLGLSEDRLYPVSAAHGHGIRELTEVLCRDIAEISHFPKKREAQAQVAIMGRPNSGKSTLFNRLLGEETALVAENPGTTRDPVECPWEGPEGITTLVDTAGIRRRPLIDSFLEGESVRRAFACTKGSQVVVYLVDATLGLVRQDRRLMATILSRGTSLVICFNKIDLISPTQRETLFRDWPPGISFCTPLGLSATEGLGLDHLRKVLARTLLVRKGKIPTAKINRHLALSQGNFPGTKRPKIKYASMVSTSPPTFLLFTNGTRNIPRNYESYLKANFRRAFALENTPIRLIFRK